MRAWPSRGVVTCWVWDGGQLAAGFARLRRCGDMLLASPQGYEELRTGGLLIDMPSERHLKRLSAQEGGTTGHDMKRYEAFRDQLGDLPSEKREVRREIKASAAKAQHRLHARCVAGVPELGRDLADWHDGVSVDPWAIRLLWRGRRAAPRQALPHRHDGEDGAATDGGHDGKACARDAGAPPIPVLVARLLASVALDLPQSSVSHCVHPILCAR